MTRTSHPSLTDVDDPALAPLRDLRRPSVAGHLVVEGALAVRRLLGSNLPVDLIVCTEAHWSALEHEVEACRFDHVEIRIAEPSRLRELVGFDFHRGCLASGPIPDHGPERAHEALRTLAARDSWTVLVGEGLADPANVGAMVRNARAFAVDSCRSIPRGASPWSRKAIRGSMGHVFSMPVAVADDLRACVAQLAEMTGCDVLAATLDSSAIPLPALSPCPRRVVLVGNEGRGLSEGMLAAATHSVTIPIDPGADSLNVAAATAVLLYGLERGRPDDVRNARKHHDSTVDPGARRR